MKTHTPLPIPLPPPNVPPHWYDPDAFPIGPPEDDDEDDQQPVPPPTKH